MQLAHGSIEHVHTFSYLGNIVEASGGQEHEVNKRLAAAGHSFRQLQQRVFRSKRISLGVKMQLYKTIVMPALMYGSGESWALTAAQLHRLDVFNNSCLRRIMCISRLQHVRNDELYARAGQPAVSKLVQCNRLRWLGHVARSADVRVTKQLLFAHAVPNGYSVPGRPKLSWRELVRRDLQELGFDSSWWVECQDRSVWNGIVMDSGAAPR